MRLEPETEEYEGIKARFRQSCPAFEIVCIFRIQHRWKFLQYSLLKKVCASFSTSGIDGAPLVRERVIVIFGSSIVRRYCVTLLENDASAHQSSLSQEMDARLDGTGANKRALFHGCAADVVPKIVQNGFNRSFMAVAAWGDGIYFAQDAAYSANRRSRPITITITIIK